MRRKQSNNSILQRKVSISFPPEEFENNTEDNDVAKEESSDGVSVAQSMMKMPKVGNILLHLNEPKQSENFEGLLYNLFTDPHVIRLPGPLSQFQNVVALLMSKIITIIL